MKIISCIKQVYDLDIVLENDWVVDETLKSVDIHYANRIINSYDEASLEMMLQLKDKDSSIETKALTIGSKTTEAILLKALAIGVDEVLRIDVSTSQINNPNDNATLIYEVIKNDISVDLVLCGKQSDINNYGQTGQILAEKLNWSCFTNVYEIKKIDNLYYLTRLLKDGVEKVTTKGPIVVTSIPSSTKFLRMATLREMIKAKKTNIEVLKSPFLLDILSNSNKHYDLLKMTIEKPSKQCKYIEVTQLKTIEEQLNELIVKYQGTGDIK